jgi:hypothetical protein
MSKEQTGYIGKIVSVLSPVEPMICTMKNLQVEEGQMYAQARITYNVISLAFFEDGRCIPFIVDRGDLMLASQVSLRRNGSYCSWDIRWKAEGL